MFKKKKVIKIILGILVLVVIGGAFFYQYLLASFLERKIEKKAEIIRPAKVVEYKYEVIPLINEQYFEVVHNALANARDSIYVVMFVINPASEPVDTLLKDLSAAQARGVKVHLIVDNSSGEDWAYRMSRETVERLREKGVDARYGPKGVKTHDKLIVIDDRVIILGAHNWTKAAFLVNDETSVLIKCSPPNPEFKAYYYRVEKKIRGFR